MFGGPSGKVVNFSAKTQIVPSDSVELGEKELEGEELIDSESKIKEQSIDLAHVVSKKETNTKTEENGPTVWYNKISFNHWLGVFFLLLMVFAFAVIFAA